MDGTGVWEMHPIRTCFEEPPKGIGAKEAQIPLSFVLSRRNKQFLYVYV